MVTSIKILKVIRYGRVPIMKKIMNKSIMTMVILFMSFGVFSVFNIKVDAADTVGVKYRTHVQNVGNQSYVSDGTMSGTTGKSYRLEGVWIELTGDYSGGISYRTHVQNEGWQSWKSSGTMSGTSGKSYRLEGIQIKLTGAIADNYDIYYRVHCQDYGWLDWAMNGEYAGSEGLSKRLEGIQITLVETGKSAPGNLKNIKSVYDDAYVTGALYRTHVQNVGWQSYVGNAKMSGTSGKSYRLEGINIKLTSDISGGITYRTHVQNVGWQSWKSNGVMAGTSGKSYRLEAIEIMLTGKAADNYNVYYRCHVQNVGWQGWVSNGATAGISGKSLRLEGIEIKLVKKIINDTNTGNGNSSNVEVTEVSISGPSSLYETSSVALTGTVLPSNATDKMLTWSSSDTSIATVNSGGGMVTGIKAGTVIITARSSNGKTATKSITVLSNSLSTDIQVNISGSSSVDVGSTTTFTAVISPSNVTDKTVTWSSSDTSIATVNSNGVVTGVKAGKAIITAETSNGKTASQLIVVYPVAEGVTLNITGNPSGV